VTAGVPGKDLAVVPRDVTGSRSVAVSRFGSTFCRLGGCERKAPVRSRRSASLCPASIERIKVVRERIGRRFRGDGRNTIMCSWPIFRISTCTRRFIRLADVAVVDAEGAFFTQAHGADRRFRHTQRDQLLFNGLGALHAQDLVEAPRTLLIGIALEQDAPIPLAREEFRVSLQGGLAVIA
jgi:hypothetical protein